MGAVKAAIGDGILTFMWVFCASTLGIFTSIIASAAGVQTIALANLVITILLVAFLVFVFSIIGDALGGASFNPTGTAAFYAAGIGSDDLISMALRFPAQAIGALGGAVAIMEVVPSQYKHQLGGPSLKVELHTGAVAEGVLTFSITFCVLFIILRGPNSPTLKTLLLSISTVAFVVAGSGYTGPSMNPANHRTGLKLPDLAINGSGCATKSRCSFVEKSGLGLWAFDPPCGLTRPKQPLLTVFELTNHRLCCVGFVPNKQDYCALQAFGWAYIYDRHNTWEQLYVYWICPFIGAIVAAWVFRVLFPPPMKKKKAE
ncbi:hypothetical protein IFM89_026727 [Coptis chinensis]|uniref:Uncharacterized protein n=1 Tax=Coptis chinensis TaxID=261450 RepID=A0A835IEU1_9MAGN|nr:hypothetical protein IFM89_026727 [Coptis chinensis]